MGNELCYLSAVEALARFKARKLSPVELMRAVIARAEAVEPTINRLSHISVLRAAAYEQVRPWLDTAARRPKL